MNPSDHARLSGRVAAWWPHAPWPKESAALYFSDLRDLDAGQVATATEAFYRDGERFPPTGAQIRAKVIGLSIDAPDWAEVKAELCKPAPRVNQAQRIVECSHGRCDGDGWLDVADEPNTVKACPCRAERIERAKGSQAHPLIREFADEVGAEALRDVWADRTAEAQVRTMWEQFVARRAQEATYAGLPDAGLPAIERANRKGLARLSGALRRVLPAGSETA